MRLQSRAEHRRAKCSSSTQFVCCDAADRKWLLLPTLHHTSLTVRDRRSADTSINCSSNWIINFRAKKFHVPSGRKQSGGPQNEIDSYHSCVLARPLHRGKKVDKLINDFVTANSFFLFKFLTETIQLKWTAAIACALRAQRAVANRWLTTDERTMAKRTSQSGKENCRN